MFARLTTSSMFQSKNKLSRKHRFFNKMRAFVFTFHDKSFQETNSQCKCS